MSVQRDLEQRASIRSRMLFDEPVHDIANIGRWAQRNLHTPPSAWPARDRTNALAEQARGVRLDVARSDKQVIEAFVGGVECVSDELKVRAPRLLPRCS